MRIKKSQLQSLIRTIITEALQVLNEASRGEWWIYPGGSSEFADGDIGDSNHESIVIQYLVREIFEHFVGDTDEIRGGLQEYEADIKQSLLDDGRLTPEEIEEWDTGSPSEVILKKVLEDKLYKDAKQAEDAVYIAYGSSSRDGRDYAMKYMGWKRMTTDGSGTNLQTWVLRESDLTDMKRGTWDAWSGHGDGDEDEDESHTVTIEVRANNKVFHSVPVKVFERASVRNLIPYLRQHAWMKEQKKGSSVQKPTYFTVSQCLKALQKNRLPQSVQT
jgi:hypothetical protein